MIPALPRPGALPWRLDHLPPDPPPPDEDDPPGHDRPQDDEPTHPDPDDIRPAHGGMAHGETPK